MPAPRARTKIVATVGPACDRPEMLAELVDRGADVFRVNMAHGNREGHERIVAAIRRASEITGQPIGILIDLAGPKIRLGQLVQDPLPCPEGGEFRIIRGQQAQRADELTCTYDRIVDEVQVGHHVLFADGTISMRVTAKSADEARCVVVVPGMLRSRQGINLPGVSLSVSALTDVDRTNAEWAARAGIDFVSLSFVRQASELIELRELLRGHGSQAMVVAKIEKREALDSLDEIVAAADGVMVARGDLGVEIDIAETPIAQKRIISTCQWLGKPVIVATQMLDSMQRNSRPTRAEASDVANAVLDGADACMLSQETAVGDFPRETVETMNRILLAAEELLRDRPAKEVLRLATDVHPVSAAAVFGAAAIAERLYARLVVIVSRSGATARIKSKQRDFVPVLGLSDSPATLRQMSLFWGITPLNGAPLDGLAMQRFVEDWGRENGLLSNGDRIVFVAGSEVVPGALNVVTVHEVGT